MMTNYPIIKRISPGLFIGPILPTPTRNRKGILVAISNWAYVSHQVAAQDMAHADLTTTATHKSNG